MIELLTTAEMGEADRMTIAAGTPGLDLMERAGQAVADRAAALASSGSRIVVVAGKGNNGGDGYVAARLLAERGYQVAVYALGAPSSADAEAMAARWSGPVEDAGKLFADGAAQPALIVDAMFGAGLHRPLDAPTAALVEAINASGVPVLAVDLPSGIDGDSGAVMGAAIVARETVTFFRKKLGHCLLPGRTHCWAIHVADIGIPETVLDALRRKHPLATTNEPALWRDMFPLPRADGHKYQRGHAIVVSGAMVTSSAARLASRGALRAGAGVVTLASPRDALAVNAASSLSIMVRPAANARALKALLSDKRVTAAIAGPGLGVGPRGVEVVRTVLGSQAAAVLDADALTSFEKKPQALFKAIAGRKAGVVLTPHEGEFSRLFSKISKNLKLNSKLEKARAAASASSAVVIYKGPDTVVAAPDGRASIAANAPPWLATAGSGDVLCGFIGGLLAQGMPPYEAACAGVWLHGEAARAFGRGLIAEDLPEALPGVLQRLFPAS